MRRNWIKSKLEPLEYIESDGVNYWREKVFLHIIFFFSTLGLIAAVLGVLYSIKVELYLIAIVDVLAYLYVLLLFISRAIRLKTRIYLTIALLYAFGLFLMVSIGPNGAGLVYLIGFSMLSAILLGLKSAYNSMILLTMSTIAIYLLLKLNYFPELGIHQYQPDEWIAVAINLLVIASLTSIPLAIIVKQTRRLSTRQLELSMELVDKNIKLNTERENAERANQLKSLFLKNMNHEIRTPLNSIIGFTDLIKDDYERTEKEKEVFIKIINESGHDLLEIINNILETSVIDSGDIKYNIDKIAIGDILTDIRLYYELRKKNHPELSLVIQEPSSNDKVKISTDINRTIQVIHVFISNAIKYSPKGFIQVGYNLSPNKVVFYVKDNGLGIPKEYHEHIFNQFYKVKNNEVLTEGVGLGLYIARCIANDLGGVVWVESEKGKGSCFSFSLNW